MNEYDPDMLTDNENYRIMTTATTPRPIGWISSTSENGVDNLAPFSHYNNVCTTHPVVMFSVDRRENGDTKHTVLNIKSTEDFVVNVVTEPLVKAMEKTAEEVPKNVDEFNHANIARAESKRVVPPRVAEAEVQLECSLYDIMEIYDRQVIFGEVKYIHISDRIMVDGKIDMNKLKTIGRLGGQKYTKSDPIEY